MAYRKTEFVERKRRETRARILEAAASLVRVSGWRGCVLKAVAERAGVSTGSLYTHFGKIADLYCEVYVLIAETENDALVAAAAEPGSAAERLGRTLDTFMGRALRGRVQAYAMMGEPVAPEVEVARQQARRRFAEPFVAIIRDGVQAGELPQQDPEVSAACILGMLSEAMIGPLAPETMAQPDKGEALRQRIRAFCLRGVGATPGSAGRERRKSNKNKSNKKMGGST